MFDDLDDLRIVASIIRESRKRNEIREKKTHAFVIRLSGKVVYTFTDKSVPVEEGEMIFIPQGEGYKYETVSEVPSSYVTINFLGDMPISRPRSYRLENFYEADYLKTCFCDSWNLGSKVEKYKCVSIFYSLLSHVLMIENTSYADRKKFNIIEPAIKYLREHIYDSTLKTDKFHKLCGISNTYFRKIFISEFGTTPQNYIMSSRMYHAKQMIDSGDFNTIKEVAQTVGYNDPLYFSKVFKKIYGLSPSDMNSQFDA